MEVLRETSGLRSQGVTEDSHLLRIDQEIAAIQSSLCEKKAATQLTQIELAGYVNQVV